MIRTLSRLTPKEFSSYSDFPKVCSKIKDLKDRIALERLALPINDFSNRFIEDLTRIRALEKELKILEDQKKKFD